MIFVWLRNQIPIKFAFCFIGMFLFDRVNGPKCHIFEILAQLVFEVKKFDLKPNKFSR